RPIADHGGFRRQDRSEYRSGADAAAHVTGAVPASGAGEYLRALDSQVSDLTDDAALALFAERKLRQCVPRELRVYQPRRRTDTGARHFADQRVRGGAICDAGMDQSGPAGEI